MTGQDDPLPDGYHGEIWAGVFVDYDNEPHLFAAPNERLIYRIAWDRWIKRLATECHCDLDYGYSCPYHGDSLEDRMAAIESGDWKMGCRSYLGDGLHCLDTGERLIVKQFGRRLRLDASDV